MIVSIFTGSPHKLGNTARMAVQLKERLEQQGAEVKVFDLFEHNIEACHDCGTCSQNLVCFREDGMNHLYAEMEQADVLVFGTPVYWFGPTGRTKLMIDRFRPYFANKKLYGKGAALLLPYSSDPAETSLTIEQFQRVFKALGMEYIDAITLHAEFEETPVEDGRLHDFITDLCERIFEVTNKAM